MWAGSCAVLLPGRHCRGVLSSLAVKAIAQFSLGAAFKQLAWKFSLSLPMLQKLGRLCSVSAKISGEFTFWPLGWTLQSKQTPFWPSWCHLTFAVRHSQPFPAQGSPEFYCDELQEWVEGNMSKLEVMGRRRWALFLHGSLQVWKMWDFQRVCHPGDQEPTSSSRLNREFIVGPTAKGQDSDPW